ncbi:MAG: TetR/AcrR family transcriptional regulator [Thermincola sp.]|jgi:AcrR family transcriptional regulator|nr:TetR/AcrR family transcriptional regulator [Thermincola sp.]MDT3704124.1 TetR/AcrR family transcriptional regulator [Thermincola sp.]
MRKLRHLASVEKNEEIFKAAANLFFQKGFKGTSMKDIAEAVGLPPGGLYYYIKSKEKLLYEITTTGINIALSELKEIEKSGLSTGEKFREAVKSNVKVLLNHKNYLLIYLHHKKALSPEYYEDYKAFRDEVELVFLRILKDGVNESIFRDDEVRLMVFLVLGMCNGIPQWYDPDGKFNIEEIANYYADAAERIVGK